MLKITVSLIDFLFCQKDLFYDVPTDHDDIVYGTNAYDRRKKMEQVETFEPVPNLQITRLVPIYQDHGGKETGRVRLELVESTTYGANPVAPPKSNYNRNRDIFDDRRLYNLV